jgi:hypothetical protein
MNFFAKKKTLEKILAMVQLLCLFGWGVAG